MLLAKMSRPNKFHLLLAGVALAPALMVCAQNYDISWHTIAGGGGSSTGGVYSVTGTIGQSDAGHMSGGNYTLDGGFWGIIAAVQTPGAPFLTITRSGANVVLSWPLASSGFTLQQNGALNQPGAWSTVGTAPQTNGLNFNVTVPATGANEYFRLKQ